MRIAAGVCAAVFLLAAAACGGSGGSEKPTTLHEWVTEVNGICVDTQKKLDALGPVPPAVDQIPGYVDQAIPIVQDKITRVQDLGPAPTQAARSKIAISVEQRILELDRALKRAAVADNPPLVARLRTQLRAENTESGHLYSLIGASRCFSESS
jgi:hypothetical protein